MCVLEVVADLHNSLATRTIVQRTNKTSCICIRLTAWAGGGAKYAFCEMWVKLVWLCQ